MRNEIREDQIRPNTQIKAIADFLQNVLPSQQQSRKVTFKTGSHSDGKKQTTASKRRLEFEPSPETVYESTSKRSSGAEIQSDDDEADGSPEIEEHVRTFGRENFGE
jgi:hypothetical protein